MDHLYQARFADRGLAAGSPARDVSYRLPPPWQTIVAKMARLKSMGAPIHEEIEFKPGFYPLREAGRIIEDLVPQLSEGMAWSEGRYYVARALLLSACDLKRQIPWAQRRWERLQYEAARERKILARLLKVGAAKDRALSH